MDFLAPTAVSIFTGRQMKKHESSLGHKTDKNNTRINLP
jgi:hypothetical protein